MRIQTLISTMNLANHRSLIEAENIDSESITINQVTNNNAASLEHNGKHKLYTYFERGLSKSRNRALEAADADICVIADDDMYYEDNYEQTIKTAYAKNPKADIIVFHVDSEDPRQQKKRMKSGRLNRVMTMKIASWQITFRRKSLVDLGIRFDESFGAGTDNYMGEENILLYDCIRKGLSVYYVPAKIATLKDDESSTWFEGYNERYFITKGAVFKRMSRGLWLLFVLQFAIRKRKLYSNQISLFKATKLMIFGKKDPSNDTHNSEAFAEITKPLTRKHIQDLQATILEIYKEFVTICKKHNLRYFAIGGTAIGAVRHKGFIPWDDDLDVAMPREDYEKFCRIVNSELASRYKFTNHLNESLSGLMFGKMSDETTTDIEAMNRDNPDGWSGVFIDIFPLDGVPNNSLFFRLHMFRLKMLCYAIWAKVYTPNRKKSTRTKSLLKMIVRAATFHTDTVRLKNKFIKLASKYDFDSPRIKYLARTWAFNSHHGLQASARYNKSDFNGQEIFPFEDSEIALPKGYDAYLSSLYPNYMTLPPKSQQKPSHSDGILDLGHSYKYYIAKRDNKRIGYTAGCYDLFHIGHMNLLRKAKQNCDYLIVGINADEAMYSYKQKYPVIPENERMDIVAGLRCVDEVVLVTDTDKYEAYKRHKYDVIFVGDDHQGEPKWVELEKKLTKEGSEVHYFGYTKHISSSKLRENLKK